MDYLSKIMEVKNNIERVKRLYEDKTQQSSQLKQQAFDLEKQASYLLDSIKEQEKALTHLNTQLDEYTRKERVRKNSYFDTNVTNLTITFKKENEHNISCYIGKVLI
jgi:septal ring factor EnvC (AmiA/AmiB activator)